MSSSLVGLEYSYFIKQQRRKNAFFLFVFILILFLACTLCQKFLIFPVSVSSESMQPCINAGDIIFVTPLASEKPKGKSVPFLSSLVHCIDLKRGDIVFVSPDYEAKKSLPHKIADAVCRFVTFQHYSPFEKAHLVAESANVRRLVGFPGDTIYMKDCVLYVKPKDQNYALTEFELSELQYDILIEGTDASWSREFGFPGELETIVLKDDEYFVLADDRSHGVDSRYYGAVHGRNIKGKLILRYWPLNSISVF